MRTRELVQDQWQEDSGARAALTTTAITLALLGGWLLWQFGHGDNQPAATLAGRTTGNSRANIAAASVRQASANGTPKRDGMAETSNAQHAGSSPQAVYVVESEDAADWTRRLLSVTDERGGSSSGAPITYRVVVVEAGRDAAQLLSEEQEVHHVEGLLAFKIVDLRLPGRVPPDGADGAFPID